MRIRDYLVTLISFVRQPKKQKLIRAAMKLKNKTGLEIGGPSRFFGLRGGFPVYIFAKKIDGVNFSMHTVWEGSIQAGETYKYYSGKIGQQFIAEATELKSVGDNIYDFLLSCHSLEHVANPIRALLEWKRVLKENGTLALVLPDKRYTFDVNRPYTEFDHLLQDFQQNIDENDSTHFNEIIQHHDSTKDPERKTSQKLSETIKNNFQDRMVHHHVFNQDLVQKMLEFCGFQVFFQQEMEPFHLITLASKKTD